MLEQNSPLTFDKEVEKYMTTLVLSKLDLEPKGQGHRRNQKTMTLGTKNMPPQQIWPWGQLGGGVT